MIIQSLWIGILSVLERMSIQSFLSKGYEFYLYAYTELEGVPDGCILKDANEILPESELEGYKYNSSKECLAPFADLFRFKMLFEKGGAWADLDNICLNKIPEEEYIIASEQGRANINFIKYPKGSYFAKILYDRSNSIGLKNVDFGENGVNIFDGIIKEANLEKHVVSPDKFNPISYYDYEWFFVSEPESIGIDLYEKIKNSYCVHLYNDMLRRNSIDKNKEYPKTCLYEILKSKVFEGIDDSK